MVGSGDSSGLDRQRIARVLKQLDNMLEEVRGERASMGYGLRSGTLGGSEPARSVTHDAWAVDERIRGMLDTLADELEQFGRAIRHAVRLVEQGDEEAESVLRRLAAVVDRFDVHLRDMPRVPAEG